MNRTPTPPSRPEIEPGQVVLIGVPFDADSSFARGAALAPPALRAQLHSPATNLCSERGIDLSTEPGWSDLGDLELIDQPGANRPAIESAIEQILARGGLPLALGGDHSITHPILRAVARHHPRLTLLHFDAHPDLYDELDGSRTSHACPFARILEEELVDHLIQIGVRTFNAHQRAQAERFGVDTLEMRDFRDGADLTLHAPLYVSLDLDVLDPAHAPGVSHPEPGGLTSRDLIDLIHALPGPIVGADIVEYNPRLDCGQRTATVGAKLLKELMAQMILTQG